MELKAFPKIKILGQIVFFALGVCFVLLFGKVLPEYNGVIAALIFSLLGVVFIPLIAYTAYISYAQNKAYRMKTYLTLEPTGNASGGKVYLDIHNIGDGVVCVKSAGLLDQHVKGSGKNKEIIDIPRYTVHKNLPLVMHRGDMQRIEYDVCTDIFAHTFAGVFYEIDIQQSEANNKYAKYLAKSDLDGDGKPDETLQKKVFDVRLQAQFCGKRVWDKYKIMPWLVFAVIMLHVLIFAIIMFSVNNHT